MRALAGLDPLDAGQVIFNRAMKDWYIPHYRAR